LGKFFTFTARYVTAGVALLLIFTRFLLHPTAVYFEIIRPATSDKIL